MLLKASFNMLLLNFILTCSSFVSMDEIEPELNPLQLFTDLEVKNKLV